MADTDWVAWHTAYDRPDSSLSRRLDAVRHRARLALDAAPPGPLRVISLCAGDGRDLIPVVAAHPRHADVRALLVERDPRLADAGRAAAAAAGLGDRVEVRTADAARTDEYADLAPAHLVLLCGIFGNVPDGDIARTVAYAPQLCATGGTVIWTRHREEPDLVPRICGWFADAGFAEVWVSDKRAGYGLGVHRHDGTPPPLESGVRLFSFETAPA